MKFLSLSSAAIDTVSRLGSARLGWNIDSVKVALFSIYIFVNPNPDVLRYLNMYF